MRHFISFQKRKGLYIAELGSASNDSLVHQLNHELMKYGYFLGKDVFTKLATLSKDELNVIYNDLISGIRRVTGGGGYEPIYRNFPQSVLAMSYTEFVINAIVHYWSFGTWRPEDAGYLQREFAIESVNYKEITSLTESEFNSIFTDIIYSGSSISAFDKQIVDWFIDNGYSLDFSKISFKETSAYVGKRLMDANIERLPIKDATSMLRIWAAYSGGDEGLKTNTRFKNPSGKQKKIILATIEGCNNIEESFKINREMWLRLLFYVNPLTKVNKFMYPEVARYADLLRNNPKVLRTFDSRVEELLGKKDIAVLDLLKTRKGNFMRRLDHTVRLFGITAIEKWLETRPNFLGLVTAYNVFSDRDKDQNGRGAVLAGQGKSEVVTYKALDALDSKLVESIKALLLDAINKIEHSEFTDKKVFIDRALYYRPLAMNNRASSLSLSGKANGTVELVPAGKVIRMYVHWHGTTDIDLSGFIITSDNKIEKVGWNGRHQYSSAVVYSGDNTGHSSKNAEYLDISVDALPKDTEWVISEARIYRGPRNFAGYAGKARAGWMLREFPEANTQWLPETIEHSVVLNNDASTAYLLALHVPTRSIVYLDLSMGNAMVSSAEDAIKMRTFLETFVTLDDGSEDIKWDKINQGHIVNCLAKTNLVSTKEEADLVFDENTTWEAIAKYF